MKRKIIITLLAMLMLTIFSVTAFAYTLGDVNGDSKITAADARIALRYSAKLEKLTDEQIKAADVDNSGKVNASDARKILRVASKLDIPFEGINIDKYLIEKGVLNVAVPKDNAPFAYEENGKLKGIDISMMQEFAESINLEVKFHPMTYNECLNAVKNGTCDIATSINDNESIEGLSIPRSYYYNPIKVAVLKTSSVKSVKQIKEDKSIKIGVLDNTMGKIAVEKLADKKQIKVFSTCADAFNALKKGTIDAFIANEHYIKTGTDIHNINESHADTDIYINILPDNYYVYNNAVVILDEKYTMIEKIGRYIKINDMTDYEDIDDKTKLSVSQNNITLAPGGTVCVEINVESFYMDNPEVSVNYSTTMTSEKVVQINNKTYLFISTYENRSTSGKVGILCTAGPESVDYKMNLTIDSNGPKKYQYPGNPNIPDFGAYTKTSPIDLAVDNQNNLIVHSYSAYDLYNNGVTEKTIDRYFEALEKAGYTYMGYSELANTLSFVFLNEKTQKYVSYVEAYDEEGYLAGVGVGYSFPDSIS